MIWLIFSFKIIILASIRLTWRVCAISHLGARLRNRSRGCPLQRAHFRFAFRAVLIVVAVAAVVRCLSFVASDTFQCLDASD